MHEQGGMPNYDSHAVYSREVGAGLPPIPERPTTIYSDGHGLQPAVEVEVHDDSDSLFRVVPHACLMVEDELPRLVKTYQPIKPLPRVAGDTTGHMFWTVLQGMAVGIFYLDVYVHEHRC